MGDLFAPFLLVLALALDAFVAALGYGSAGIRIPNTSLGVLAAICSGALGLSLWAGNLLAPLLPSDTARQLGCGILMLLGIEKLVEEPLKALRQELRCPDSTKRFSLSTLFSIYCSPRCADLDDSRSLSPAEASALALALSLDGVAAGLGAGAVSLGAGAVVLCSLVVHWVGIRWGEWLGRRLSTTIPLPFTPLCGLLLLLLAVLKL